MPRFLAPAGAPVHFTKMAAATLSALSANGQRGTLLRAVADRLKVRHVFPVCSGRAGLAMSLRALRRLRPERDVVAVPAYTCFSVAASVVNAGLKLAFLDMDPEHLELRRECLEATVNNRTLCVLSANLFGYVNDPAPLESVARERGAFVVDDAAQAMGAMRSGKAAGGAGDLGMFSLGRGKAITTGCGGLVIADSDEIASVLREEFEALPEARWIGSFSVLLSANLANILLNPALYWMPNSMPFLRLGVTEFDPNFRATKMPYPVLAMLKGALESLDELNAGRRQKAAAMRHALAGNCAFRVPEAAGDCEPNYVRLPVSAASTELRDQAVARLWGAGIGATSMYPTALCDIPGIERHVARDFRHQCYAESIAGRLLTLPTHAFVTLKDMEKMVDILHDVAARA